MRTDSVEISPPVVRRSRALAVSRSRPSSIWLYLAIFGGLLLLAVLLQVASGAYHSEFSAYPDEPAHYVTSLMVREYIIGPHPFSPVQFAQAYYAHYPKVAFGHWPPLFYLIQAFWMLLFSAARASVRLEIAFTTALLGLSLWHEVRRWLGSVPALLGAILLVCLPLVQESTDQEMAETLLALCCFWSTIYFGRFLDSERLRDSLLFGLYFALAVLTKGSAWLLVFVPVFALLLTRKVYLVRSKTYWLGLLLAAVLCLPWQILTFRSAQRGWAGGSHPSVGYTLSALWQFFGVTVDITGPVLILLVGAGIVIAVVTPFLRGHVQSAPAVLFGLLFGDWIFHSLVPAGVENRKMIMAVPALIYFLLEGGLWLARSIPPHGKSARWKSPLISAAAAGIFFGTVFTVPKDFHYGYKEAASFLTSDPHLQAAPMLVSSGSIGEGLLISEVAMRQPRPQTTILRGTKVLAHADWLGSHYKMLYQDPSELLQFLGRAHVKSLVVDTFSSSDQFPHEKLVRRLLKEDGSRFRLLGQFPGVSDAGERGQVQVYELLPPTPPA